MSLVWAWTRRLVPAPVRRSLDSPRARRVRQLTRRSVGEYNDDHCAQLAAAMSFHMLFSIFPVAVTVVGVIGLTTDSAHARDRVMTELLKVVPLNSDGQHQVHKLLDSISGGVGAFGLLGLVGILWSASGVMGAVRHAVNIAWDVEVHRPYWRGKARDLLLLALVFPVLALTLGFVIVTDLARQGSRDLPGALAVFAGPGAVLLTMAVTSALLAALFTGLYWYLPAVHVRVRDALAGAVFAGIGVGLLQFAFSAYVSHFANYNRVYGSLGAIIAFLFFAYLASVVFLLGAEVASELPRMRAA